MSLQDTAAIVRAYHYARTSRDFAGAAMRIKCDIGAGSFAGTGGGRLAPGTPRVQFIQKSDTRDASSQVEGQRRSIWCLFIR
jgi:hypothetical protein